MSTVGTIATISIPNQTERGLEMNCENSGLFAKSALPSLAFMVPDGEKKLRVLPRIIQKTEAIPGAEYILQELKAERTRLESLSPASLPACFKAYVERWNGTFPLEQLVDDFAYCYRRKLGFPTRGPLAPQALKRLVGEAKCAVFDGSLPAAATVDPFPVRPIDYAVWLVETRGQELDEKRSIADLFKYFRILLLREELEKAHSVQTHRVNARCSIETQTVFAPSGEAPFSPKDRLRDGKPNIAAKLGATAWREINCVFDLRGLSLTGPSSKKKFASWEMLGLGKCIKLQVLFPLVVPETQCTAMESNSRQLRNLENMQIKKIDDRGCLRRNIKRLNEKMSLAFGLPDALFYNENGETRTKFKSFSVHFGQN